MRAKLITVFVFLLLIYGSVRGFRGYRDYQRSLSTDLNPVKFTADKANLAESARRAEAVAEARRLADLRNQQNAKAEELRLVQIRTQEASTERARLALEIEAAKAAAELVELNQQRDRVLRESRRLAEIRETDAAAVALARDEAIHKLEKLHSK